MTRSEQVILEAGKALREGVLTLADDMQFHEFQDALFKEHRIGASLLAPLSGIDPEHYGNKRKAGFVASIRRQGREHPVPAHVEAAKPYQGKPLTHAEHGDPEAPKDWQTWWLENCPPEYRAHLVETAFNSPASDLDFLTAIYRVLFDRAPDDAGRAHFERALGEGVPPWCVVVNILRSPEMRRRSGKTIRVSWV